VINYSKGQKYINWIDEYAKKHEIFSKCAEVTTLMKEAFPELTRVRGEVYILPANFHREHWWLVDELGAVVDPTADQYFTPFYGYSCIMEYLPRDESLPEVVGVCTNCGQYCLPPEGNSFACSKKCHAILEKYYNVKMVQK
jgi:hypothetical protein